jgi:hypothetical protein
MKNKHLDHAIIGRADRVLNSNPKLPNYSAISRGPRDNGSNQHLRSQQDTRIFDTSKKQTLKYTGDALAGIATMHKSNAVPVLKDSEMLEAVAKMRRN